MGWSLTVTGGLRNAVPRIFIRRRDVMYLLRDTVCRVNGIMRQQLYRAAGTIDVLCCRSDSASRDVARVADEVLICNAMPLVPVAAGRSHPGPA